MENIKEMSFDNFRKLENNRWDDMKVYHHYQNKAMLEEKLKEIIDDYNVDVGHKLEAIKILDGLYRTNS